MSVTRHLGYPAPKGQTRRPTWEAHQRLLGVPESVEHAKMPLSNDSSISESHLEAEVEGRGGRRSGLLYEIKLTRPGPRSAINTCARMKENIGW